MVFNPMCRKVKYGAIRGFLLSNIQGKNTNKNGTSKKKLILMSWLPPKVTTI
jgi:hypothetical protein